jgi:hypothetical protein
MERAELSVTPPNGRYATPLLRFLNLCIGLYVIFWVLPIFYRRLMFPGVLEHQESMTIFLLHRMSESVKNLYQMPSLQSDGVIYNPAYYFYLWALQPLLGFQSTPIRLASVLPPLLGSVVLIEIVGRRYLQVRWLSWAWAFLVLVVYPRVTWIDLARPEALLLFSIVLIWFAICVSDAWRPKFVFVGLAVAFAFAVKQPGALYAVVPLLLAFSDRRYFISAAVAIVTIGLFVAVMHVWFGPAYLYWVYDQPSSHPFSAGDAAARFWHLFVLAPIVVIGPLLWLVRGVSLNSPEGKYLMLAGVTFVVSMLGAGKLGGWYYQYVILLCFAIIPAADIVRRALYSTDPTNMRRCMIVFAAIIYSIAILEWQGGRQWVKPGQGDRDQQARLLEVVRSVPGETWITTWPHIDLWAGHPVHASIMFLGQHQPATEETELAIRSKRFALILTSAENPNQFDALIEEHYLYCGSLRMRSLGARMFLPLDVWAKSKEECEAVIEILPDPNLPDYEPPP